MTEESTFDRVLVIVLDSAGIGELPDAANYGDSGAATFQHTAAAVGGLAMPVMQSLGLGRIAEIAGIERVSRPLGLCGKLAEISAGKDTTTGHWEMMGLPVGEPFPIFPKGFPAEIVEPFVKETGRGVLGNRPESGTKIIEELGAEHLETGKWILYTSADSVFQLAAHEEKIPLDELYSACRWARGFLDAYRVGRVIARPFIGKPGAFERTYNRHDFSVVPTGPTVLTALEQAGIDVVGVGKIKDIYAGVGVTRGLVTSGNRDGMRQTVELLSDVERGLIFVNLVDFDMRFGHRRNPQGYARAFEEFDAALGPMMEKLGAKDLLLITADHGCDPTFMAHTDHTREYVPLVAWSPAFGAGADLSTRDTFADLGATVAWALGVEWVGPGHSILPRPGREGGDTNEDE
ncbi:MAG TPA: phosphopentomutase [Myxococcota bacterium]|nr:phosphopentomutase [Myxococcota bacterium]